MMNQIKELNNKSDQELIIEIRLLLSKAQKKIIISLTVSAPITALELKEFISKDFEFHVNNMIFFYPLVGIIDNNYIFNVEPNKKIFLDLILNEKKSDINKISNEISKINDISPIIPNSNKLICNQNNINNLINYNNLLKNNNQKIDINKDKLVSSIEKTKENKSFQQFPSIDFIRNNITIHEQNKDNQNIKFDNILNTLNMPSSNFNKLKENKCNFISKRIDNSSINNSILGKKRVSPTTFKTTIPKKENENTKPKIFSKSENTNNNYKIINFNVNKSNEIKNE